MLIVTIHDVAPPFLADVDALRAALAAWGVGAVTLLAIPDHHRRAPLAGCPATVAWLRARAAAGDEIALHGVHHRQDAPATRWRDRVRAAALTAGEGEMLGAGAAAPGRLVAERDALARLIDAPVVGFVAPAWLEPRGLGDALAAAGFGWHETALAVERLAGPRVRRRAPVIGFATRERWRERAALAWAAALAPALETRGAGLLRVALHPADRRSPAVLAATERVVRRFLRAAPAVTTRAALGL